MSADYFDNLTLVSRPRTWGRGLHGIYDESKHQRRHSRNFLKWYVRWLERPARNIVCKNGLMLVPGEVHDNCGVVKRNGWMVYERCVIFGREHNRQVGYTEDMVTLDCCMTDQDGYRFFRDGIPTCYGEEAQHYDEVCKWKNHTRKARPTKDEHHAKLLKEIKLVADKRGCELRDKYDSLPSHFRKEYESLYANEREYLDCFRSFAIQAYSRYSIGNVCRECEKNKGSAKESQRQLRALGFVA